MKKNKKYIASLTNSKHRNKMAYLFLLPWLIGAVLLSFLPLLMAFGFSFTTITDVASGYKIEWKGGANYIGVLLKNVQVLPAILQFLKTEIIYVPIVLVMSFILATILVKGIHLKTLFRTIFFLPVIIISGTLVSIVFTNQTDASEALAVSNPLTNSFIYRMIASYSTSLADLILDIFDQFVMILWLTGIPVILFINGLQKINKNMYEAAKIDGANKWQILWKITIPNVLGIAFVCSIFAIVQISALPITDFYALLSSALAQSNQLALACTYSVLYVILILLLILLFKLILVPREKKQEEYITLTMKQQLDQTMKRMQQEVK